MKIFVCLVLLFVCELSLALDITIKGDMNIRSSPNFIGSANIVGLIKSGAKATVVQQITLKTTKTIAYKISLSSVSPANHFINRSGSDEVWVYGSPQLVDAGASTQRAEGRSDHPRCDNCGSQQIKQAVKPLQEVVRHVETEGSKIEVSADAKAVVESLNAKGFTCDTTPEQIQLRGVACKGRIEGYPQPVRVFVPKDYVKNSNNKLNIFFHGFEARAASVLQVNKSNRSAPGDFGARLAESGSHDTIVVVPEGRSRANGSSVNELTYSQYFQDGSGQNFEKFLNHIKDSTGSSFSSLSLAAHSGGYLALDALLGYPSVAAKINRAALFDGAYSGTKKITDWINSNPANKMHLSWTTHGEVVSKSNDFSNRVERKNQLKTVKTTGTHMDNIRDGGYADFLKGE